MSRRLLFVLPVAVVACTSVLAAPKGIRLWNLTGETLDRVELAPAGTQKWGKNQCANDQDGTVDFDEHLPIKGVSQGRYDVRVRDVHGKVCVAKNVEVKAGAVFAIRENDLTDCSK
jgi:hypothetical protein